MTDDAPPATENSETSVFQSALSIADKIERARTELLDLSARNRLLNVPRFSKSAKTIDIVGESTGEVFRILVGEGKPMTFLAGAKPVLACAPCRPTSSLAQGRDDRPCGACSGGPSACARSEACQGEGQQPSLP